MRNLKRALSLAMASIMLLGMMVVGTSAASINDFSDVDEINNKEAVAIATGLGIFDGYDTGDFKPENIVTRAEMAVIICKILHGSDVDPANFAGAGKFTDVPAWAEGYVNLCASLGIIVGVGDGKFAPNQTVTTAEASTMLLKALGYYVGGTDTLGADWKLEVTSKATALGLYGDMTLAMNAGLTRENVAEMTFNTLFAQRVAYDDYRGLYVKASDRNVVVTNGTEDDNNTLAKSTFGMYAVEGIVTANGYTDVKLTETSKSDAQTTVMFTEETDLNKDGKFEYDEDDTYDFEYATGLDMIGHAAKVYYKIEKKAPVVFAIVDRATKVEIIDYNSNTTRLAEAANDAGFKKNTILDVKVNDYIVNYDMGVTYGKLANQFALDTLLVISNSGNYNVDYVIALDQYLDVLDDINDRKADVVYTLADTTVTSKGMAIPMGDVDEDDYVIVTKIGNDNEMVVFEKAETVDAEITRISGRSAANAYTTAVLADGVTYKKSNVSAGTADVVAFADIDVLGAATLILGTDGKLVAIAKEKAAPNYAYVAQFGVRHATSGLNTKYVLTAHVYFADGTNGIYEVDLEKSTNIKGYVGSTDSFDWLDDSASRISGAVSSFNKEFDYGQPNGTNGMLGLWDAKVLTNGKIQLTNLTVNESDHVLYTTAANDGIRLVKGHSTLVTKNNVQNVGIDGATNDSAKSIYQNDDTVYFYVTGTYNNNLRVQVFTGIDNAYGFTTDTTKGIKQLFVNEPATGRNVAKTMLIKNVNTVESDVYYYDEGDFDLNYVDGDKTKVTITYNLHDKDGNATTVTYDNGGKYFANNGEARDLADQLYSGFYTLGMDNLERHTTLYGNKGETLPAGDSYTVNNPAHDWATRNANVSTSGTAYVVNDYAQYDEFTRNLFGELTKIGFISKETKVVDLTGNDFETVTDIVRALSETNSDGRHSVLRISYSYANNALTSKVLYVTEYKPDASTGTITPNTNANLLNTVQVNGAYAVIADGYSTARQAVANATKLTLSTGNLQTYTFDVTTKPVIATATGWEVNAAGVNAYGAFATYADEAAAQGCTLTAVDATANGLNDNNSITLPTAAEGNYIVFMTEAFGTVTYYAYYLAK